MPPGKLHAQPLICPGLPLQFHEDKYDARAGGSRVTGYGNGFFEINEQRHAHSLVIDADGKCHPLAAMSVEALEAAQVETLLDSGPDLVLLGTGGRHQFVPDALATLAASRKVAIESMNSGAACRTYNVLAGEGRRVAAVLLCVTT